MTHLKKLPRGLKNSLRALLELTKGSEETNYFNAKRVYERGRAISGVAESDRIWEEGDDPKRADKVLLYLESAYLFGYVDRVVISTLTGFRINPNKIDELEKLLTEK